MLVNVVKAQVKAWSDYRSVAVSLHLWGFITFQERKERESNQRVSTIFSPICTVGGQREDHLVLNLGGKGVGGWQMPPFILYTEIMF